MEGKNGKPLLSAFLVKEMRLTPLDWQVVCSTMGWYKVVATPVLLAKMSRSVGPTVLFAPVPC